MLNAYFYNNSQTFSACQILITEKLINFYYFSVNYTDVI